MHSYEWNSMGGEIIPVRYGEGRRWGKREGNVCPPPLIHPPPTPFSPSTPPPQLSHRGRGEVEVRRGVERVTWLAAEELVVRKTFRRVDVVIPT